MRHALNSVSPGPLAVKYETVVASAVSTVLVSRAGMNAFHAAFWVVFATAAAGALIAPIAFPRHTRSEVALVPV